MITPPLTPAIIIFRAKVEGSDYILGYNHSLFHSFLHYILDQRKEQSDYI